MYYTARKKALNNGRVYHLAAVLRRGKTVIKIGENTFKTHPRFGRIYPDGSEGHHMHAEMNVLRFAKPGDTIEVMRFCGDKLAMAKPCPHCMRFMKEAGIKKVSYTNQDGDWETIRLN